MKKKFKQSWSTIPLISTKETMENYRFYFYTFVQKKIIFDNFFVCCILEYQPEMIFQTAVYLPQYN